MACLPKQSHLCRLWGRQPIDFDVSLLLFLTPFTDDCGVGLIDLEWPVTRWQPGAETIICIFSSGLISPSIFLNHRWRVLIWPNAWVARMIELSSSLFTYLFETLINIWWLRLLRWNVCSISPRSFAAATDRSTAPKQYLLLRLALDQGGNFLCSASTVVFFVFFFLNMSTSLSFVSLVHEKKILYLITRHTL